MAIRETVREMTKGQLKELAAALTEAIPTDLPFDTAKGWIGNKSKLGTSLRAVLICDQSAEKKLSFEVDFDNPEWDRIDRTKCSFVGEIKASDYPRKYRGKKRVTVRLQKFDHDTLDRELINLAKRQNEQLPDRATTETFGRTFPNEQWQSPIIGICGNPVQRDRALCLPYVGLYPDGVGLDWHWTDLQWSLPRQFVVVCSVVDL